MLKVCVSGIDVSGVCVFLPDPVHLSTKNGCPCLPVNRLDFFFLCNSLTSFIVEKLHTSIEILVKTSTFWKSPISSLMVYRALRQLPLTIVLNIIHKYLAFYKTAFPQRQSWFGCIHYLLTNQCEWCSWSFPYNFRRVCTSHGQSKCRRNYHYYQLQVENHRERTLIRGLLLYGRECEQVQTNPWE